MFTGAPGLAGSLMQLTVLVGIFQHKGGGGAGHKIGNVWRCIPGDGCNVLNAI